MIENRINAQIKENPISTGKITPIRLSGRILYIAEGIHTSNQLVINKPVGGVSFESAENYVRDPVMLVRATEAIAPQYAPIVAKAKEEEVPVFLADTVYNSASPLEAYNAVGDFINRFYPQFNLRDNANSWAGEQFLSDNRFQKFIGNLVTMQSLNSGLGTDAGLFALRLFSGFHLIRKTILGQRRNEGVVPTRRQFLIRSLSAVASGTILTAEAGLVAKLIGSLMDAGQDETNGFMEIASAANPHFLTFLLDVRNTVELVKTEYLMKNEIQGDYLLGFGAAHAPGIISRAKQSSAERLSFLSAVSPILRVIAIPETVYTISRVDHNPSQDQWIHTKNIEVPSLKTIMQS